MISPIKAIITFTMKTFDFSGRSPRSEFCWFFPFWIIVFYIMKNFYANFLEKSFVIYIMMFIFIIQGFSLLLRRLHDTGVSGYWLLINFTPALPLLMLWLYLKGSDDGNNQYGSPYNCDKDTQEIHDYIGTLKHKPHNPRQSIHVKQENRKNFKPLFGKK